MITLLGGGSIARGVQQIASQPVQLGLVTPLIRSFDDLPSLRRVVSAERLCGGSLFEVGA